MRERRNVDEDVPKSETLMRSSCTKPLSSKLLILLSLFVVLSRERRYSLDSCDLYFGCFVHRIERYKNGKKFKMKNSLP
ncbi:hypothetical protein Tcan_12035 [Toxocara canis]|uniref:Uncharacterized protein n=1 Tax=Toxocara canis TaxID=6265 RepID=A0A0B2VKM7_TOXCA|nr:hypothetical protein Tcan_12035 [Toxocara canis]